MSPRTKVLGSFTVIVVLASEVVRFKSNKIVCALLDNAQARGFGLNELATMDFTQADWEQFYQLIGYSLSGYHELSFVSDEPALEASRVASKQFPGCGGCRDGGCEIHCGVPKEDE